VFPIKHLSTVVLFLALLPLGSVRALAQDSIWAYSYQLEASGQYLQAISALDPIAVNNRAAEYKLLRRAWLYFRAGAFNESIREYRLAIERNNKSVEARLGLLLPLLSERRWQEAELGANNLLALAPNNYLGLLRLAIAMEGQREWVGMLKTTALLINHYPSDVPAYVYHARANAWLGYREEATAAYAAVLARQPGNLEARAYFAQQPLQH